MKKKVKTILYFSVAIFLVLSIQLLFQHPPNNKSIAVDFTVFEGYGSALTGIFSIVSVYLLYKTLTYQVDSYDLNQFENRVFELIRYHRDNVDSIKMRAPDKAEVVYYDGRKALREIHKQMILIIKDIRGIFENNSAYKISNLNAQNIDEVADRLNLPVHKLDLYNVAYLCLFFGLSEEGKISIEDALKDRYSETCIKMVIAKLNKRSAKWQRENKIGEGLPAKFPSKSKTKYFGGHQYRLGHFFRHLFQIVTYIDNNNDISFAKKYEYVKILRAQLSTYEQTLIFFNSISKLGMAWELNVDCTGIASNKQKDFKVYRGLITKYNFIRNVPNEFITSIRIDEIYPNITFESCEDNKIKKDFLSIYKKKVKYFKNRDV
ncbi:putative phage abortive infection protein [Pedobacter panaciterrae]|uniref:Phage abortive infection protein n=1 Tax=Pedobacter panaciterrae TaxID=363849 RepID=A0ABU8NTA3_9SPHI